MGEDGQFHLSVRTSMLSEFRDASGALGAFELSCQFTSIGSLCTALERLPGVRIERARTSLWSSGPSRFLFKERMYLISTPFEDIRIAPLEGGGVTYPETEELFRLVVESLVPKWQSRARSRFYRL